MKPIDTYYKDQLAPALELLRTSNFAPKFTVGSSNHMNINLESLDALQDFIDQARSILLSK